MNLIIRSYSNSTSYKILKVLNKILLRFFCWVIKTAYHYITRRPRLQDWILYHTNWDEPE